MNVEFPELHDFFGAYFHQDWLVEHETAEQVLDSFLTESHVDDLIVVLKELNALINLKKDELVLKEYLLKELSCYYCYWNAWPSGEAWLRHIASRLTKQLGQF
jgi:hypothetical protein